MTLYQEYLAALSDLRSNPSIDLCYLNIAQYDALLLRRDLYGDDVPQTCPAYKLLSLLYEMQGRWYAAAETTREAINKGIADAGAPERLRREETWLQDFQAETIAHRS